MSDDYEYEAPPVADEMSVVAAYGGGGPSVPSAEPAEDVEYNDDSYWDDSGDGGDWANEPQDDAFRDLRREAIEAQLDQHDAHEAWKQDYAQRHADAMAVKEAAESEEGFEIGDRLIDQHLGHPASEGTRAMIWQAGDALLDEYGAQLRQQGYSEQQVASVCLQQAAELVRDAEISDHAIRTAGLNR